MGFELFCATLIALVIGLIVCFGGYRFFLVLLPIWGFFFGLFLGAQSMQLLFGVGFFATITSWVVGVVVGALFAVLSYMFYAFAVALIAGSIGYGIGVALMGLIFDPGFITWIVGMIVAIVAIVITFRFNIQKYVIIVATAVGGAGAMIATLIVGVENVNYLTLADNPIQALLDGSFWWWLVFLVLAIGGIVTQIKANANYTIEEYNNWA